MKTNGIYGHDAHEAATPTGTLRHADLTFLFGDLTFVLGIRASSLSIAVDIERLPNS